MKSDLFDLDNQNSSYNFSLLSDINRPIHFWKDRNMLKDIIKTYRDNPGFRPLIRGFFFYWQWLIAIVINVIVFPSPHSGILFLY